MRVAKNTFLVEVDEQFVSPVINGFKLIIDSDFNPRVLATKIGRIHTLPVSVAPEYKYDNKLQVSDTVIFNHNVCQNNKKFAENIFFCDYFNVFAKVIDSEIQPLEDVLFCEKLIFPDRNIGGMEIKGKVSNKCAKVFAVSNSVKGEGVEVGDVVFFTKDADYEVEVLGKSLYKMHLRNIIGIERGGELKTFRNKLLVKNTTKMGCIGAMEKIYAQSSLQNGVVIVGNQDIPQGTLLAYYDGIATKVEWNGEDYSFIDDRNIKYIK